MVDWSSRDCKDVFYILHNVMLVAPVALGCGFSCSSLGSQEDCSVGQRKEEMCSRKWGQGVCTAVPYLILPSAGNINYSLFELVSRTGKETIAGPVLSPRPCYTTSRHLSFALCSLIFGYFSFLRFLSSCCLSLCSALVLSLHVRTQDRAACSAPSASPPCLASCPAAGQRCLDQWSGNMSLAP